MGQQAIIGGYRAGALVRQTSLGPVHEGVSPKEQPVHLLLLRRPEQVTEEAWHRTMATFDADLKAVAALKHPNIVHLRGVGEENGVHFVVMDPVPGETLAEKIPAEGTPILARVAPRFAQICAAVAHAHEHGVIHGDLSPDDILITPDGQAQLSNFGMAHIPRQAVNRYMAPEVIEGQLPDALSDLFSLGAILYEMVAGHPAFTGVTGQQVRDAIVGGRPPGPLVEQPPYVQAIVLKALSRKREMRYQSAAAILDDLRAKRQPAGFEKQIVNALGEEAAHEVQWHPAQDQVDHHAQEIESLISAAEHIQGAAAPPPPSRSPRRWIRASAMAAILMCLLAVMQHARGLAHRATFLEAVRVSGTASSFRLITEVPKSLVDGSRVSTGDTIQTGANSSVLLRATDGTVIRVGSDTRLTLTSCSFDRSTRRRNRTAYLQKGRVVVRAAKQRRGSVLAISTPRARVSVVGTVFSVETPKGLATTIGVLEGMTQVAGTAGMESIGAGKEVEVAASGAVGEPEALPDDTEKLMQDALAELRKLEGRFADLQQALLDLEEGTLVVGTVGLLSAIHLSENASDEEIGEAGALAKATASMVAICGALETAACEEEGDYPASLDLATLEELGLGKENAKVMLSSFEGGKLESYIRTGSSYEFTARAKDKAGTLLKATQGRVSKEGGGESRQ